MDAERLKDLFALPPLRSTSGVPDFLFEDERRLAEADMASDRENAFKNFFKRWPRFYDRLALCVSPILFTGLTANAFMRRFVGSERIVDIGSGHTRLHPSVVTVDIFPFPNVDVLAAAERLPFVDSAFDVAICDQVLEHVKDPHEVMRELLRVTKSGGWIYIGVPFVYPLHPSPKDYARWSTEGVSRLLPGCRIVEQGVAMGPTSGMLTVFASWLSLLFSFGISPLRKFLNYVFMIVLHPLKYLDYLLARLPGAETIAATIYVVARKD